MMEKVTLNFQDANINLQEELIDKYLGRVNEKLVKNPSFLRLLQNGLSFLTTKVNLSDRIPLMELSISEDGRTFEIASGIRPDPDCRNELLQNNKNYRVVRFTLDEKDNMDVLTFDSTLYNFDDYMKTQENLGPNNPYNIYNSKDTPTILSVFHKNIMVSEKGVEVSRSTYQDQYPLSIQLNDEKGLKIQTSMHSPKIWRFNTVPDPAYFEFNPIRANAYRFNDSLGLITYVISSGKNSPIRAIDYVASSEYPEILSANPAILRNYDEKGYPSVDPNFKDSNPGKTDEEIIREVEQKFAEGVEYSRTKELNPEAYEAVKELVNAGLEKKYGITVQPQIR